MLDGVPRAMPALLRAAKLARRAAREGADTASADPLAAEADRALAAGGAERLGEFLFALSALAGARGVDAEAALREACARFEAARGERAR